MIPCQHTVFFHPYLEPDFVDGASAPRPKKSPNSFWVVALGTIVSARYRWLSHIIIHYRSILYIEILHYIISFHIILQHRIMFGTYHMFSNLVEQFNVCLVFPSPLVHSCFVFLFLVMSFLCLSCFFLF